jgi:hypothetical protein
MTSTTFQLLADVVAPYPGGRDLTERRKAAVRLIVEDETLPQAVSKTLDVFVQNANEEGLRRVQEAVARSKLLAIGSQRFVELVAQLMMTGQLTQTDGAALLSSVPYPERARLTGPAAHLVDVAAAVLEDARDGVMEVDEDQLLREAIASLVSRD